MTTQLGSRSAGQPASSAPPKVRLLRPRLCGLRVATTTTTTTTTNKQTNGNYNCLGYCLKQPSRVRVATTRSADEEAAANGRRGNQIVNKLAERERERMSVVIISGGQPSRPDRTKQTRPEQTRTSREDKTDRPLRPANNCAPPNSRRRQQWPPTGRRRGGRCLAAIVLVAGWHHQSRWPLGRQAEAAPAVVEDFKVLACRRWLHPRGANNDLAALIESMAVALL